MKQTKTRPYSTRLTFFNEILLHKAIEYASTAALFLKNYVCSTDYRK